MRVLEKIELLNRIGSELQLRMSYSDINVYLGAHGVDCKDFLPSTNSKWVYVKELLANADENLLLTIANDLELEHNFSSVAPKETTFWRAGHFKLFLSHLTSFKVNTAKLQNTLKQYAISSFVAHEDIEPSKEWQIEIEAALQTMDAMAAVLMPGFKESNWCDQEVGVAVARDVLIIPVRKGLDPYGFIGKYQGIQAKSKNLGEVAGEIFQTIISSPKTRTKILRSISNAISQSTEINDATDKVLLLHSIEEIPEDILKNLSDEVSENNLLINSLPFIRELNKLFDKYQIDKLVVGGMTAATELDDGIPF